MKTLFLILFVALSLPQIPAHALDQAAISVQSDVSVTGTSTLALAADINRTYLLVVNKGSVAVLLKYGSAHSASEGVYIPAGGNYEPSAAPMESVYLKSVSGTQTVSIVAGTR